jgi:diaminopimelate epimerase
MERFFKYHGLGNDFVVLDHRQSGGDIDAAQAVRLCDRRHGIGADGVLVLLSERDASARMVVHNADGSVAEMCGNGLRCAVKHLADADPARPPVLRVATDAGLLTCRPRYVAGEVAAVEVEMGRVSFPFVAEPLPGHPGLVGTAVHLGNPHLVIFDRPLDEVETLGPVLERHPLFPHRTNVEWVSRVGQGLKLRVWERGSGLTLACGTGACAAAAAAVREGRLPGGDWLEVELPGGKLSVKVAPDLSDVWMRGPAVRVFEGQV